MPEKGLTLFTVSDAKNIDGRAAIYIFCLT